MAPLPAVWLSCPASTAAKHAHVSLHQGGERERVCVCWGGGTGSFGSQQTNQMANESQLHGLACRAYRLALWTLALTTTGVVRGDVWREDIVWQTCPHLNLAH